MGERVENPRCCCTEDSCSASAAALIQRAWTKVNIKRSYQLLPPNYYQPKMLEISISSSHFRHRAIEIVPRLPVGQVGKENRSDIPGVGVMTHIE